MSRYYDPFNADRPLQMKCHCGADHTLADHLAAEGRLPEGAGPAVQRSASDAEERLATEFVQASLVKALVDHSCPKRPAAAQEVPDAIVLRSSSTTSFQPILQR